LAYYFQFSLHSSKLFLAGFVRGCPNEFMGLFMLAWFVGIKDGIFLFFQNK